MQAIPRSFTNALMARKPPKGGCLDPRGILGAADSAHTSMAATGSKASFKLF
jgi:hypothetical protein